MIVSFLIFVFFSTAEFVSDITKEYSTIADMLVMTILALVYSNILHHLTSNCHS